MFIVASPYRSLQRRNQRVIQPPCLSRVTQNRFAQGHVQSGFGYFQGLRLHNPSKQIISASYHPRSKKNPFFLHLSRISHISGCAHCLSCPWAPLKNPIILNASHEVFMHSVKIPLSFFFSTLHRLSSLSFSLYVRCFRAFTASMALLWPVPSMSMHPAGEPRTRPSSPDVSHYWKCFFSNRLTKRENHPSYLKMLPGPRTSSASLMRNVFKLLLELFVFMPAIVTGLQYPR